MGDLSEHRSPAGRRLHIFKEGGRRHDVGDSGRCWCRPALYLVCPECGTTPDPACGLCHGADFRPIPQIAHRLDDVVIIHNPPPPRDEPPVGTN